MAKHESIQAGLRAEYDTTANTFTRWDENGEVVESRPMNSDEKNYFEAPLMPEKLNDLIGVVDQLVLNDLFDL